MQGHLELKGCRHDILGHYLKAIGLLRVLARCADEPHRDTEAEGWWDMEKACFCLRSSKYPTIEKLVEFFEQRYRPTPVFSPWNTGGGLEDKQEVVISFTDLVRNKKNVLKRARPEQGHVVNLISFLFEHRRPLTVAGLKVRKTVRSVRKKLPTKGEISFALNGVLSSPAFKPRDGVRLVIQQKTSGKKSVIARVAKALESQQEAVEALNLGRQYFSLFQDEARNELMLLERLRDEVPSRTAEAFDAIFTTRTGQRAENNPLFLNRGMGEGGNDEMFRQSWVLFLLFHEKPKINLCRASLLGEIDETTELAREIGYPFFPDAIKAYNIGSGWVQSSYPFNALDYLLAIEGAYALRGAASKAIGASSRRFAAFPFVFDTGEELTDGKDLKRTAAALWLPIWDRATSYEELASFICDAQARLPGRDARFSAEFVRALNAQGVDAGFAGWQEFRFKLKGSRVPWVSTGAYVGSAGKTDSTVLAPTRLNRALRPLDEAFFLDQFDPYRSRKTGKLEKDGPHHYRQAINSAMETAALEPTPRHCLVLLEVIFGTCRQMCVSKTFREKLNGGGRGDQVTFFKPMPMSEWDELLDGLDEQEASTGAEFRIARALASIAGMRAAGDNAPDPVEPMMGSILPLKVARSGWYLPDKNKRHRQDVWSGSELSHDLAAVLQRRYMDSLKHERPALMAIHYARLDDVLAFLRGELDDRRIARWTEAMSLIDWRFTNAEKDVEDRAIEVADNKKPDEDLAGILPAYAALRTLLEVECEWQGRVPSQRKKRRSQQPFTLLCQRSVSSLPLAISEALRWISIWGVRNPWGAEARAEKKRVTGRYVVSLPHHQLSMNGDTVHRFATRLAAAVCIPLAWEDRWQLARVITLPPGT